MVVIGQGVSWHFPRCARDRCKPPIIRSSCFDAATASLLRSPGRLLIALTFSGSAQALPEMGPTSSARIKISVSVASQYSLQAKGGSSRVGLTRTEPGAFCLKTNSARPQLPVMLTWHSARDGTANDRATNEMAVEIQPCGADPEMTSADARGNQPISGIIMVRPE